MRNTCGAFGFDAAFEVDQMDENVIVFRWEKDGKHAQLRANFADCSFEIQGETDDGTFIYQQE